jgi:hypothetical protein
MSFRPRPEPVSEEHHGARRARLEARKRRTRWAAVLVAALILGAAGTVAAFALTDDIPASTDPAAIRATEDGAAAAPSSTTTVPADTIEVRPLTHEDPLRLWIGGDSLAGALGPALGDRLGATGIVAAHVDYKVSSGLVPGPRDWPEYATELLAERDPEVVVFMVGTNDANIVNSQDANDDGVADWEPGYRARVQAMMDQLVGDEPGRTVVWIGAPTMRDEDRDEAVVEINRIMVEEAARRAPNVIYYDAYTHFADEEGEYTDRITDADGDTVRARVGDGVHFTPLGAEHLAEPVFALLDARFRLTEQADPAQPIGFTMDENGELGSGSRGSSGSSGSSGGSGSRSGTRSGSGGSGGSGSRTATTVAPAEVDEPEPEPPSPTAPPATSPPPTSPPATVPPSAPAG